MKLIAGLGNPGQEYAYTRHNMGWLAVDHLVQALSLGRPAMKFRSEFWRASDFILLKPLTFMNLSGFAVREAFDFYKLNASDLLIVYDDLALPFGQLRLRGKGSAGGHNGLASILGAMGTLNVPRLRIGLGDVPGNRVGRVLGHLPPTEMAELPFVLDRVEKAVNAWLALDLEKAMSQVNAKTNPSD